ncbi:thioesterase family protein [[Phormidium] sp. ETS-05]|uniref:acyl-CoA thioesterase n=1 Tax=[Phormidium] sp. ETS-05 TaxID=222819 RepID=UPI0018EF0867|nr:thioesterase family protein [[Phormidium] sp. ETS-05]
MPFIYHRTVHFQDTDAAGVVYFANVLSICHEAYEASLSAIGIDLRHFFRNSEVAIPIVHASADFLAPMFCGDLLEVRLLAKKLSDDKFDVNSEIFAAGGAERCLAKAVTRHLCIQPAKRTRQPLPPEVLRWLEEMG